MRIDLIYRDIIFQINSNFCFPTTFFLPCRIRFIHFHFQLVEKFEHVQTFQLIEINFRFFENVKLLAITLHNLLNSRNRIQLNRWCNARLKSNIMLTWEVVKIYATNVNYLWQISEKIVRSSHQRCSIKISVLKSFAIFTGKHLYWSLFLERDSSTGAFQWILRNL